MMANSDAVRALYLATCNLTYTVNDMATNPTDPFTDADKPTLHGLSTDLGNAALGLRSRDADKMQDQNVNDAAACVKLAQGEYDFINQHSQPPYPEKGQVVADTKRAIQAVNYC